MPKPFILVIDPAMKHPELECLNQISRMSPHQVTYHLPAMFGMASLKALDSEMSAAKGIIVLGSAASVNERQNWQVELETWLMPWLERKVPTAGFCYGHQMLAHMFGGTIDYVSKDQVKLSGFREVEIESRGPWKSQRGPLVISHRETVATVPKEMLVFGKSLEVPTDALAHKSLPIFSFQSHPEAVPGFMHNQKIDVPFNDKSFKFGLNLVREFLEFCR